MTNRRKLLSPADVAEEAGTTAKVVRDVAADLGVGQQVAGRLVLDEDECEEVLDHLEEE